MLFFIPTTIKYIINRLVCFIFHCLQFRSIALCIRNVDVHLNCPDACRGQPKGFCKTKAHTLGTCSTRLDELIGKSEVVYANTTESLRKNLRDWYRRVPVQRRFPMEFFMKDWENKELFFRKVAVQKIAARVAYCPCRTYYKVR